MRWRGKGLATRPHKRRLKKMKSLTLHTHSCLRASLKDCSSLRTSYTANIISGRPFCLWETRIALSSGIMMSLKSLVFLKTLPVRNNYSNFCIECCLALTGISVLFQDKDIAWIHSRLAFLTFIFQPYEDLESIQLPGSEMASWLSKVLVQTSQAKFPFSSHFYIRWGF